MLRRLNDLHFYCVCNETYCDTINVDDSIPEGKYVLYTTSQSGSVFEKSVGSFLENDVSEGNLHFEIDPTQRRQCVIGFGTAFTDSAGLNLKTLSEEAQNNLLGSYFSSDGIEMNMGRVPIGGTDFSTRPYTYDDVAQDDDLSHFALVSEDLEYKIPIILRAKAMSKSLKLLSAAWSAPAWMKTNNAITGFGFLREKYFKAWAEYHIKFLDAYKEHGLEFWATSTGNEPTNGIIPVMRFNSMGWSPHYQATWVADFLGPSLNQSQHSETKILALDDQRFLLPWWISHMMSYTPVAKYISGIAVHWYWDTWIPPSLLTETHYKFPDKFIVATEASKGDKPWESPKVDLGSWRRGVEYMTDIIQDMNNWVTGWVDWNFALDLNGGPNWVNNIVDSAILINKTANEFYKQPMFYAIGHFSKFVPEGSCQISVTPKNNNNPSISLTAFSTPDGGVVVVLLNQKGTDGKVTLRHPRKGLISIVVPKNSFNTLLF